MGKFPKIKEYKIEKTLHKGNRYNMYFAIRISDNIKVVIKEPIDNYENSLAVTRLINEFKLGKKINHKNIIKYIDLINIGPKHFMIREYFDSVRLNDYIGKKACDIKTFLTIAIQITEGLSEIHKNSIVHQLIKPSNIIINEETLQIKIVDFGRSTYNYETQSDFNNFKDSVAFISPEQTGRINRNIDYRTDFYSLGVTFYKILTDKLPFDSDDILELVHSHIAKNAKAPHKIKNSIPEILSKITLKLLTKNSDSRYQSAEGIISDLEFVYLNLSVPPKLKAFQLFTKDFSAKFRIPQKIYGRKKEIDILHSQFTNICLGDTRILLLTGLSGIGKSAIVNELRKEITIKNAYFASGKYEQLNINIAYSAISYAFRKIIKQILGESNERNLLWKQKFQDVLGNDGQIITNIIPELELIIGKQDSIGEHNNVETQNLFNILFQNFVSVFNQMNHPIVIFLDDLQWIDFASLNLIKYITSEQRIKSLFLIGAYRSDEVDDSHPVITMIKEIENNDIEVKYLNLKPLNLKSINNWVADTLNCNQTETKELSDLILKKTNGNPFFIKSFLQNLYDEKLIYYKDKYKWHWNIKDIIKKQPTDNVTDLMVSKINKLPEECREMLTLGACFGIEFGLSTLSIISQRDESEVEIILEQALISGMIIKYNNMFRFVHDKVLEAAYSYINDDQKPHKHLQIGRLLLLNTSNKDSNIGIFEITQHFNKGKDIIPYSQEKNNLIELNIRAAKKAKSSAAFSTAMHYFQTGIELLGENCWDTNRNLAVKLKLKMAECCLFTGKFDQSSKILDETFQYAVSDLEKVGVYKLRIIQYSNEGKYVEALKLGIEGLKTISFEMPVLNENEAEKAFFREIEVYREYMKTHKISDLYNLPINTVPNHIAVISIMELILDCAITTAPNYFSFLSIKIVNLAIKNGITFHSIFGFSAFGITLVALKKYNAAYQFGQLALKLNEERIHNSLIRCKTLCIFGNFQSYLKQDIKESIPILENAYRAGIISGDTTYAAYASAYIPRMYVSANYSLKDCEETYKLKMEAIKKLQNKPMYMHAHSLLGFITNLRKPDVPSSMSDATFNEKEFRKENKESPMIIAVFEFHLLKFNYLLGKYSKAIKILFKSNFRPLAFYNHYEELSFFAALLLAANYEDTEKKEQTKYKKLINEYYTFIKGFSNVSHNNFYCHERLVKAEIARIENYKMEEIVSLYDQAIKSAKENGFILYEAMAYETSSRFFINKGLNKIAGVYLTEAHNLYYKWGAIAKTKDLEKKFPYLLSFETAKKTVESFFDISTIVKVTQAISREIITENLLAKLIQIILENAGAQKGYIVLKTGKNFTIAAGFNVDEKENKKLFDKRLKNSKLLSENIIRYVIRTGENVILKNAKIEGQFINDNYIKKNNSKSVLAIPVRHKNEILGALFLENNLYTNVFSEKRIKLLDIVLAQAAISLENARLYKESIQAEEEIRATYEELQQTNSELLIIKEKIEESEIKYKKLYNDTPVMMHSSDLAGVIISVNDYWLKAMGYDYYEVIGTKASKYLSKESQIQYDSLMKEILKEGILNNIEIQAVRKNGELIDVLVSTKISYDKSGKHMFTLTNMIDISLLKEAQKQQQILNDKLIIAKEKAEESDKLKTEFINNMSHEIRTPMNGIIGFANFLDTPDLSEGKRKQYTNIIKNSGFQLLRIIDDILEISKLGTKQVKTVNKKICLNDLLLEQFSVFDIKAKERKIHLYLKKGLSDKESIILSDETKLNKILSNLLENAIKFTHTGYVEFGYKLKKDNEPAELCLFVRDTGIGISKDKQETIFKRFFQAEEDETQNVGGLGLGLSIAKENTELLGGTITLESEKGKGSTFHISIPYKPAHPKTNTE